MLLNVPLSIKLRRNAVMRYGFTSLDLQIMQEFSLAPDVPETLINTSPLMVNFVELQERHKEVEHHALLDQQ